MAASKGKPGSTPKGRLFVITAPSGAGKTTLVKALIDGHPALRFSVSHTTRPPRPGEKNRVDYYFVEKDDFNAMIRADDFLEYAEVFGHFYGTGRDQVEQIRKDGHDVLLEIDWQRARQVRANQPDCRSIFVMPPSVAELEKRLRGRGTDTEDVIRLRLGEAVDDMSHWREFDHVVINDKLKTAVASLKSIMAGGRSASDTADPALGRRVEALLGTVGGG
jgi:guanylate kinase